MASGSQSLFGQIGSSSGSRSADGPSQKKDLSSAVAGRAVGESRSSSWPPPVG